MVIATAAPGAEAASCVQWPRQTLVWLRRAPCCGADTRTRAIVAWWCERRWPLIVRRSEACAGDGDPVALGLPLPPAMGKVRIALTAPRALVRAAEPLPTLASVAAKRGADARPSLLRVLHDTLEFGIDARVFGAWAWQALTGLGYVTASSDVDLHVRPRDRAALRIVLARAAAWDAWLDRRLDLEIALPGDETVAWREWSSVSGATDRVLVKGSSHVALRTRAELLARLPERC